MDSFLSHMGQKTVHAISNNRQATISSGNSRWTRIISNAVCSKVQIVFRRRFFATTRLSVASRESGFRTVVARASRRCVCRTIRTGGTPVPLPTAFQSACEFSGLRAAGPIECAFLSGVHEERTGGALKRCPLAFYIVGGFEDAGPGEGDLCARPREAEDGSSAP